MFTIRVDPHVHLYDQYPLEVWYRAALANLGVSPSVFGVVVVVDREGQDSFGRFRRELSSQIWEEQIPQPNGPVSRAGVIHTTEQALYVVQGVQYISAEKIEVLGLGVQRCCSDGLPCGDLIRRIASEQGIVCLPWSPGKWFGTRGRVVRSLMDEFSGAGLLFGDISLHTRIVPPSLLLRRAAGLGFTVVRGTDPLPRPCDATLVGSYGFGFESCEALNLDNVVERLRVAMSSKTSKLQVWGRPNSIAQAFSRFISTL